MVKYLITFAILCLLGLGCFGYISQQQEIERLQIESEQRRRLEQEAQQRDAERRAKLSVEEREAEDKERRWALRNENIRSCIDDLERWNRQAVGFARAEDPSGYCERKAGRGY